MSKRISDFKVIENKRLTYDFSILVVTSGDPLPEMLPGQFVQVRVDGSSETFLRRPISIHDIDYERNTISLLVQSVGKGTERLCNISPGESLNLIYPLGNSFTLPANGERLLLVGGGCGIAPLLFLGKHLVINGFKPEFLLGFRNKERAIEIETYSSIGKVYLTTEDGSAGEKGFVTNHSVLVADDFSMIYCCGPDSMMKAVAAYSAAKNIPCEVSLENLMACGIGVCLCCIVPSTRGNICTCTEGPVFNIKELKW